MSWSSLELVDKGCSFREYAIQFLSARQPPPDMGGVGRLEDAEKIHKVDSFYLRRVEEHKAELDKWMDMSEEEAEKEAATAYENEVNSKMEAIRLEIDRKAKYEIMLSKVKTWIPPSKDHLELKAAMIEELEREISRINSDTWDHWVPVRRSGEEWRQKRIKSCMEMYNLAMRDYIKEKNKYDQFNVYIRQFFDSLPKENAH